MFGKSRSIPSRDLSPHCCFRAKASALAGGRLSKPEIATRLEESTEALWQRPCQSNSVVMVIVPLSLSMVLCSIDSDDAVTGGRLLSMRRRRLSSIIALSSAGITIVVDADDDDAGGSCSIVSNGSSATMNERLDTGDSDSVCVTQ